MPGLSNLLDVDVIPMINLFNYDFFIYIGFIYIYSCIGLLHFLLNFFFRLFSTDPLTVPSLKALLYVI